MELAFEGAGARGAARRLVDDLTIGLIGAAASRRQAIGRGAGARAPAGLARGPVDLVELEEVGAGGKVEPLTERGAKTARRRAPPVMSALAPHDGRRLAAERYAVAVERLGAVSGVSYSIEAQSRTVSDGVNDGGATARVQRLALIRLVKGVANGWRWSKAHGCFSEGGELVVLAPSNRRGDRKPITAMTLIDSVCVEGMDMRQVLEAHGWSPQSRSRKILTDRLLAVLEEVADALGLSARVPVSV